MEEVWTLISISLAMLIGCYLAGVIPLTVSLSEEKLKLVTVLGAGLLVGTALAVIIPEGVNAMYNGMGRSEVIPLVLAAPCTAVPPHQGHCGPALAVGVKRSLAKIRGANHPLKMECGCLQGRVVGNVTHAILSPSWVTLGVS